MHKARLMNASLAAIAAMLVTMPPAARAQSFNATGAIAAGSGAIDVATPGQTNVFLDSPVAVIDWATNEPAGGTGPITFQTAGTTATYINRDATNFTVLNRITPNDVARPVRFNGTVNSRLQDLATGLVTRGGTLFFYSPGGILVGSTGVFDVGSLVLTASDLAYDPVSGDFGSSGTYKFLQANPGSSVQVQAGARITASQFNSYVALVAPKVVNAGTITVDGSTVLVAADASTITFRPNGLFDIQIDQGTSDKGEVVTNEGTITGAAGSGNSAHRIYVVAVPKNDAITMAIKGGSKLGFDIAGAADVVGNAIVLSAGYDITGGEIGAIRSTGGATDKAALTIGAIEATSQVTGRATGLASIGVQGGADASFASNVSIAGTFDPGAEAADGAFVSVSGVGSTLDISGDLAVTSLDSGIVLGTGVTDSGVAQVVVNRGTLSVDGDVDVNADRSGFGLQIATGGEANFSAINGAAVTIGKDLTVAATGTGQAVSDASSIGSFPGAGGSAHVSIAGGSTVGIAGNLNLQAAGFGGAVGASGFAGTNGVGGIVLLEGLLGGGKLTVTGTTLLDARGVGAAGFNCLACTVEGGIGTGGFAGLTAADGTRLEFGQAVVVDASGLGGAATLSGGKTGGAGFGGEAILGSGGGVIVASAAASILADGTGGAGALTDSAASGVPATGGLGGDGTAGTASLSAAADMVSGLSGAITITGDTIVSASGTGGAGGTGGNGFGGGVSVSARQGTLTGGGLSARALGLGGAGYNGGEGGVGSGGLAQVMAYSAVDGDSKVTFGTSAITARGSGGAGSGPEFITGAGGAGGAGTGGVVSVLAEAGNGALQLGPTTLNASGAGGAGGAGAAFGGIPKTGENGGAGGVGRGGLAQIGVVSGTETGAINTGKASFAGTTVSANGIGGTGGAPSAADVTPGFAGRGGNAYGGAATLVVQGGVVTLSAAAQIEADARGGATVAGGQGGDAFVGGQLPGGDGAPPVLLGVGLDVASRTGHADQAGALTGTTLAFSAIADAGNGGSPAAATILDHPLTFHLDGGTINAGSLDFQAAGIEAAGAAPSTIALVGGDTTLSGKFNFATPGTLTAALGGAELFSTTTSISASNWLPGPVPAATPGTLHGSTSVSLLSDGDLFANLSVESGGNLTLNAIGLVRFDNLTATDLVLVEAGTTLNLGNVVAGASATLTAVGNATIGSVNAGGDAALSADGAFTAGAITSKQSIRVDGATGVTLGGNAVAGSAITLVSDGAISGAGLSAGLVSPSPMSGASYDITVFSKGAVTLGNLAAAHDIKLFTPLDLTVGGMTGRDMAVLAGGKQTIGSFAATGRVLLADYEMTIAGGDPQGAYDLNALFAALPIAGGGSITVLGNSNAGSLTATSVTDLTTQALTATGSIDLQSGGAMSTRAIEAGGTIAAVATATMSLTSAKAGDLLFLTGGEITTGALVGANGVTIAGLAGVTTGTVDSSAGDIVLTATGDLATSGITANGAVGLGTIGGNLTTTGAIRAGSFVDAFASGAVSATGITSGQAIRVEGTTSLTLGGDAVAGDAILLVSDGAITGKGLSAGLVSPSAASLATYEITVFGKDSVALEALSAAGDIKLFTPGALTVGALTGREIAVLTGGNQVIGSISATGRVLLADYAMTPIGGDPIDAYDLDAVFAAAPVSSGGSISVLGASSAGSFTARSLSDISTKAISTARTLLPVGSVDLRAGGALETGAIVTAGSLDASSGTTMDLASASSEDFLVLNAGGAITTGDLGSSAGSIGVTATGPVSLGAVRAATGVAIDAGTSLAMGSATTDNGDVVLDATGAIAAGNLAAANGVLRITAGGAATLGDLFAFGLSGAVGLQVSAGTTLDVGKAAVETGELRLTSVGAMTAGDLTANGGVLTVNSSANAELGNLTVFGLGGGLGLDVSASGTLGVGSASVTTGELRLTSGGALTGLDLNTNAGVVTVNAGGSFAARALTGHDGITVTSGGNATLTGLAASAGGDVVFGVTGALIARAMTAAGQIRLTATGAVTSDDLTATGALSAKGTALGLGNLAGSSVGIDAATTLGTGTVTARTGDAVLSAAGDLATGAITASGSIKMTGIAAVTTGDLTADSSVLVRAGGDATLGSARGTSGTVELRSDGGSLSVGAVNAGSDAALAAANDLTIGAVNARDMLLLAGGNVRAASLTSSDGRILVASNALVGVGGPVGDFNFDSVFAAPLQSTGGSLAVTGKVSTGAFTAAVGGDTALIGVDAARSILIDAGGTARLGGVLQAPQIELRVNDLSMPAGSGLNAGLTGTINLVSRNAAGMRIGDGLDDSVVAATGFTLDNAEWRRINSGSLTVFGLDGSAPVDMLIGTLDMTGPDAGSTIDDPTGTVRFRTGASPKAAASGAIRVTGALKAQGFRAGNTLAFETGQFQLASDTGSVAVLGKADALSGILRIDARDIHVASAPLLARIAADPFFAGLEAALDIESAGGSQPVLRAGALDLTVGRTLYIQRSGAGSDPLGFDDPLDGFQIKRSGQSQITVIINGTFRTASGVIGGIPAWQLFKDSGADLSGFTADSRLNGCLLSAATCGVTPQPEPQPNPDPGFRTLIEVLGDPGLTDTPPDDPDKPASKVTNAILPPQIILPAQPDALPVQIDEPIAGGGNAALIGGAIGMNGAGLQ